MSRRWQPSLRSWGPMPFVSSPCIYSHLLQVSAGLTTTPPPTTLRSSTATLLTNFSQWVVDSSSCCETRVSAAGTFSGSIQLKLQLCTECTEHSLATKASEFCNFSRPMRCSRARRQKKAQAEGLLIKVPRASRRPLWNFESFWAR